jgi:hypothetical protein
MTLLGIPIETALGKPAIDGIDSPIFLGVVSDGRDKLLERVHCQRRREKLYGHKFGALVPVDFLYAFNIKRVLNACLALTAVTGSFECCFHGLGFLRPGRARDAENTHESNENGLHDIPP